MNRRAVPHPRARRGWDTARAVSRGGYFFCGTSSMSMISAGSSGVVASCGFLDRVADRLAGGAAADVVGGRRVDGHHVVGRDVLVRQRVGERVTGDGRRRVAGVTGAAGAAGVAGLAGGAGGT